MKQHRRAPIGNTKLVIRNRASVLSLHEIWQLVTASESIPAEDVGIATCCSNGADLLNYRNCLDDLRLVGDPKLRAPIIGLEFPLRP